jgi:hypothetical protein
MQRQSVGPSMAHGLYISKIKKMLEANMIAAVEALTRALVKWHSVCTTGVTIFHIGSLVYRVAFMQISPPSEDSPRWHKYGNCIYVKANSQNTIRCFSMGGKRKLY